MRRVPLLVAAAMATAALAGPASARPTVPDPGLALRAPHALAATLPATDGGTPGGARLAAEPVTGRVCAQVTEVRLQLPALQLSADTTGERYPLGAGGLTGCTVVAQTVVADLLAHPETYSLVVVGSDGQTSGILGATPAAARPWAVGTRTELVVDPRRGTPRRGSVPAHGGRRLVLSYWYPAQGPASDADIPGADPSFEGPFPVVLFAHGFSVSPQTYQRTLHAWAAAGYVVVAPLFPGSGGGLPGSPTEADLVQQPRDLRVVLDRVQARAIDPTSWLGGVADTTRVAVAGHSDGGSTAAAAGLLARYTDPRYDAVIVMAGARFDGTVAATRLPLLLLSGERDEYNAPSTFAKVFAAARGPRAWVQAVRGAHEPPFVDGSTQAVVLRALEVDFLDRWLQNADTRIDQRVLAHLPGLTRQRAGGF